MNIKNRIKLLTIDLDDTLWPCMPTIMQAEQCSYDWFKKNFPEVAEKYSINDLRDQRKQLMLEKPELQYDLSAARRMHFKTLADEFSRDYDWIELAFKVFFDARQKVTFYADVLPVLSRLKEHYCLAALTNGNADANLVGLGNYFDLQVSAADVSAAKPDPAMFFYAMTQLQFEAQQTLHIGDHTEHDIAGAKNAGIQSVWLNREKRDWPHVAYSADYEVSDLYGLLSILTF